MKDYEQLNIARFPNLRWGEFTCLNNKEERLAIDDLSFRLPNFREQIKEAIESIVISSRGFIYVFSAQDLARKLNYQLNNILENLDPESSLIIFPGNGAKAVRDLLDPNILKYFPSLELDMIRRLATNMSVSSVDITTPRAQIRKALPKKISTCILIDDVIGSGTTAQSVRSSIDKQQEYTWFAGGWMMLSPLQVRNRKDDQYRSGLLGFERVVTSLLYQGESGIPANNSLSSFAESGEKAESVISRYRERYIEDKYIFDEAIEGLRRLYANK